MNFSLWLRPAASAVMAALLFPATAVHAQCETDSRWQRVELNLGSGIAAPIVENAGQLPDDVAYTGISAAGTATRFHSDGSLTVLADDHNRLTLTPMDADGAPAYAALDRLAGDVTLLGVGSAGTLEAWGALKMSGLWGEASAEVEVTGRTWRALWTGPAHDLQRIAFQLGGIGEATSDPSGELRLSLAASPHHTITLFPAKATSGEETTHMPFAVSADGVVGLDGEVPEGASLEMLLVFAPYSHDRDAVADGRGGYVGVGPAVDALQAGESASGRDIAIVRIDESGRGFNGMTVLASSGDDTFAGITASAGDVWIAGAAGAADFPVAAKGKGASFPSPFVARLDGDGQLTAGTHVRTEGIETVDDLAINAAGRVLVAGRATASAETTEPIDMVAVLPSAEGAPMTLFTLAELSPELDGTSAIQTFTGADSSLPMEVRPTCERIEVGLTLANVQAPGDCPFRWNRHEYPTSFISPSQFYYYDNYVEQIGTAPDYDSWGYHALRWKEQFGTAYLWNPFVLYSPSAAASTNTVPTVRVNAGDHLLLDALENNSQVFPNGNPAGSWLENDAFDYLELALGASAYLEFWGSPTYANLRYDSGNGQGFATGAVAITDIDWCANPSGNNGQYQPGAGPLARCRTAACPVQNPNCRFPIDQWDDVCATDVAYTVQSGFTLPHIYLATLDYSHWDGIYTEGEQEVYWQDVRTRFDQAVPNQHYIADPPADVAFAQSFVSEGVQRELARVVEDVPVTVTTYVGGQAESSQAASGLARAVDRIVASQQ